MRIRIDVEKVAEELATNDTMSKYNITRDRVVELLDIEDNNIVKNIQLYYRNLYDHYFEILTNHAL